MGAGRAGLAGTARSVMAEMDPVRQLVSHSDRLVGRTRSGTTPLVQATTPTQAVAPTTRATHITTASENPDPAHDRDVGAKGQQHADQDHPYRPYQCRH
jgi:hypothetical protein